MIKKEKNVFFEILPELQPVAKGVAMEICVNNSRIQGHATKPTLSVYHACVLNLKCEPKFRGILIISVVIIKFESVTKGVSPRKLSVL